MNCPHCGAENLDDAMFCTQCGKDMTSEVIEDTTTDETPDEIKEDTPTSKEDKPTPPSDESIAVEEPPSPNEGTDISPSDKPSPPEPTPPESSIESPDEPSVLESSPPHKKGSGLKVILIIISVLAVVAIISVVAIIFGPRLFKGDTYTDDFAELDSSKWSVWRKGDNVLIRSQGGELVLRNATLGLLKDVGKDYLIECGVNILSTTKKDGWAGLSFRADDSGRYIVMLYPDKDKIVLKKQPGGVVVEKKIKISKGRWYLLAVNVDGNKYAVFLSKKHIMTGTDIGFIKGSIGLEASNSTAIFDDFYVEKR